jgi:hypothetical protein
MGGCQPRSGLPDTFHSPAAILGRTIMTTDNTIPSPTPNDAERLAALLKADACIPYVVDSPDHEYRYITLSVYGAPKTNELFIRLTNGEVSFVEAIPSPLIYPFMEDRIFGIDVMDDEAAITHALGMWERYKQALITKAD